MKEGTMAKFACANVVPGCEGVVEADTTAEVMEMVAAHAAEAHGLTDLPDEVIEKVKAGIEG